MNYQKIKNEAISLTLDAQYLKSIELLKTILDDIPNLKSNYVHIAENYMRHLIYLKNSYYNMFKDASKVDYMNFEMDLCFYGGIEYCEKALKYGYSDSTIHHFLGELYYFAGDYNSAILNYYRAAELGSQNSVKRLMNFKKYDPLFGVDKLNYVIQNRNKIDIDVHKFTI